MIDIGKKLSGRYEIIGNIGSGGMANVFLARDLILDREVAIKVLRFDFQNDQTAIRRFQREALAATELVHPNVVSVYDVGEENDMQYIVMEYVKGMDLKRYIQTNYPIPYRTVVDIMDQILSAVALAHDHRIIHRDLKPQNVLINEDGVVKIADFGIAIALSETSITQTNSMLGSVHYLSPEQARGSMATKQSDIYATGIILYEMLTGQVPFDGESAVTIALKHFQDELPYIRDYNANTPQSLENIVLHATAKDPADRYRTAEEMQEDLETVLDPERLNEARWEPKAMNGETMVIAPVTPSDEASNEPAEMAGPSENPEGNQVESKPKKGRKKRAAIIGIALVLIALLGWGLYVLGSGNKEVVIPDLKNKTEAEARAELVELKLEVADDTIEIPNDEVEKGHVVRTDPEANQRTKEGREITLYISSGAKTVTMTNYVGKDYDDAVKDLKEKGFTADRIKKNTISDPENDSKEDEVLKQDPGEGIEVDPTEATVTLTVSKGPEKEMIGDYLGWSYDNAKAELERLGMVVERKEQPDDTVTVGEVVEQDPQPNSNITVGSTVVLTVSTGPESFELADLYNLSQSAAEKSLKDAGLNSTVTEESSNDIAEGNVIRTNPGSGASVKKGDTVTLIVSTGPETKTSTFDVVVKATYKDSVGGDSQTIKITKVDDNGTSESQLQVSSGSEDDTTLSVTVKSGQSATIRIQRNNGTVQEVKVNGASTITAN